MSDAVPNTATSTAEDAGGGDYHANIAAQIAKARATPRSPEAADESAAVPPAGAAAASGDGETPKASSDEAKPAAEEPDDKGPKPSDDPKMAGKFAALARKSEKVRQREDAVNATLRQVAEREQRVVQYEQHLSTKAAAYEELDAARRDPSALLAYLVKHRVPLEGVVQHSLAEQDPALRAELTSKRALSETEAIRKENAELKAQREEQAASAGRAESEQAFATALSDEAKHPAANLVFSRGEAIRAAYHLDKLAKSRGLSWGIPELAQAVNEFAEAGYELDHHGNAVRTDRYSRMKARLANSPPSPTAASAATTQAHNGTGPHVKPARTLTNSGASERATEVEFEDLEPSERIRRLAARARLGPRALTG